MFLDNQFKMELPPQFDAIEGKDGFYLTYNLLGAQPQVASAYGIFYVAHRPCEVLWVAVRFGTANGAALTLDLVKCEDGVAATSGSSLLATPFNLNSIADLVQTRSSLTLLRTGTTLLKENDALGLVKTGNLTSLAQLNVILYLKYLDKGDYK